MRPWPRPLAVIAAGVALILLCGSGACSVSDGQLGRIHSVVVVDGGAACGLVSPLVRVQGRPTCTGRLASSYLSNALCACGNVQLASSLLTRGFDSRHGPFTEDQPDQGGASVGVNGSYISYAAADIGGSFSIAGPEDVMFRGALGVRGDLWVAGNVVTIGTASVARNAWFGGNYVGLGVLTVAGALHHGGTVTAVTVPKPGSDFPGPVVVPKPCPCEPRDLLDVGAIVEAARLDNDNGTLGIAADKFASVTGTAEWTLPCGRAFLSGIGVIGSLTVHVTGMSAIFIDDSITVGGSLLFDVAPGAEIDVFVRRDVGALGRIALSSKDRPSAGRLWVGGSQPISLAGPWVGNLYAPHAMVAANVLLDVWGSIFANEYSGDFVTSVRFDRSIAFAGATCDAAQPAAGECNQCGVCSGGNACVSGACGACVADTDCCSLSICANGTCAPWLDLQSGQGP